MSVNSALATTKKKHFYFPVDDNVWRVKIQLISAFADLFGNGR